MMFGPRNSLLVLLGAGQAIAQLPLRLVSFNIRYDNTDISITDTEKYWLGLTCASDPTQCRAPGVIKTLTNAAAEASNAGTETIIGLQEALDNQLNDIMTSMASPWAHIGVGRDDGATGGEYNPIIYRTDVFNVVHEETKWLSQTPDTPSKSWDSGSNRIVTIGVFDHIATGRRFIHANTHLDNANAVARTNQIGVAVDLIKAVDAAYGPNLPISLTGDFNSGNTDAAYTTLVADNYVQDMYTMANSSQRSENFYTYTGFSNEAADRIDYIWLGPETSAPYKVNQYQVLDNLVDGVKISDHRPVVGDVTLG